MAHWALFRKATPPSPPGPWARLFLAAVAAAQDTVPLAALYEAVFRGDEGAVIALAAQAWSEGAVPLLTTELPVLVAEGITAGAAAAAPQIAAALPARVSIAFNEADPRVTAFISQYSGTEIREISAETMQAIRTMIRQSYERGRGVAALAREIRQSIGLTERQTVTLSRYREGLAAAGRTPSSLSTSLARRTQQMIRQRATVIARNELLTAENAGAHLHRQQLVDTGMLHPETARVYWLVARDERLCPRCRPIPGMNPDGVRIGQHFATPNGPVLHPPLHIQCRCSTTLRAIAPERP